MRPGICGGLGDHGRHGALQRLRPEPRAVLDHHAHATGVADAAHRRRLDDQDQSFLNGAEALEQRALDRRRRLSGVARPLLERLQHDEHRAGVGRVGEGGAGEPDDADPMRHAGRLQRDIDDLAVDLVGARERGGGRQLHHADQVAHVLVGDEAHGRLAELVEAIGQDARIGQEHDGRDAHDAPREPAVARGHPVEAPVEEAEEEADRARPQGDALVRGVWLQEQRAHGGRKRQGDDQRDERRAGDGQRELAVELARDAGDEGRGHEHGREHQRDGDERRAHLVHALPGRIAGRQAGGDIALDVFHHDDGVVHHDADGQHQAEQRQVVEREAEQLHHEEGADQRHRDRRERDDGGAPGLQEQHHHQHDQDDGLEDGRPDGVHRLLDELSGIVDDGVLEAGREALRQVVHRRLHRLRRRQGVGARPLEDADADGRVAVEIGVAAVVQRGQVHPADVLDADDGVLRLLDDDVAELAGIDEAPQRAHGDLEGAGLGDGRLIEDARGHLHVLRLQRRHHVAGGEAERLQPVRVEPDAHGVVAAAEHGDGAHAVDAAQHVLHLHVGVVGDEQRGARLVGRVEVHDHHQVGRGLVDRDADVAHVQRQPRRGDRHAVLHLHLRDVEVGAEVEGDRDGEAPVSRRVRRDVEHVLDAVHLLLDGRHHRGGDHVGAGARILAGDVDDGRRDLRELGDGEAGEGHEPQDDEHDRDDAREDRAVDEEMRDAHGAGRLSAKAPPRAPSPRRQWTAPA